MATGLVARFDCRRGYGFVIPDDGGEDVFVHQNNIEMDGFRYLQAGEKVSYELEVGEKGLKAVQVRLMEPREPGSDSRYQEESRSGGGYHDRGDRGDRGGYKEDRGGYREDRGGYRDDRGSRGGDRGDRRAPPQRTAQSNVQVDKLRRKLERLINLMVEKNVLAPGEIDGIEDAAQPAPIGADLPDDIADDGEE